MNLSLPYNSTKKGNSFYFTTDKGIDYKVSFDAAFQTQFKEFQIVEAEIIELSFAPVNTNYFLLDSLPHDARIKATVFDLVKVFFQQNEKAIIYNCLTLDNKQKARSRLFNKWFNEANIDYLVKFDSVITIDTVPTFFQSLIVHKQNPKIEEVKKVFFDLSNELNK